MDPGRITRGVISLTTGDSRRGSLGSIFRFLCLCVCVGVQRGLSRVLIKYSGNVRLQIGLLGIHHNPNHAKIKDHPKVAKNRLPRRGLD